MARDAIATCFGQHDACPHFHETQLPTRLLDVGSEARHPKLFVTNGETGKYIALSHCWGKGKPLRLMKASFESFRNKILLADLPALFRDAVLLTRQLGVSYLWIDSLCIVQDDPSDWERESALMCNLYANAYVTIALSSLLGIPDTDYDARPLDYTQEERFVGCTAPWENSFLISRGWVLQERLISQRTLHYTEAGLIWECATAMFCECLGPVSQEPFERSWKEEEPKGLEGSLELWAHLVQWYTGLALTYESDRLIALAGLAARFEKQTDSRYICGVWLDRSLFHLANQWDTKMAKWCPPGAVERNTETCTSPSWSWASISGVVRL
ncbi:HET-domain-containing protein, partial [Trichodelitschia bisporula]